MAISAIGEGCHKQMENLLPQIMEGVLNFLQDSVCGSTAVIGCKVLPIDSLDFMTF